jgi:hypothetical protein
MRICELEDEQFSHHFKSAVLPIGQLHLWKGRGRGAIDVMEHTFPKRLAAGNQRHTSSGHLAKVHLGNGLKRAPSSSTPILFANVGIEGIGGILLALAIEANKFSARQYGCRLENKRRIGIGGRNGAIKRHRQDGQKPQLVIPHGPGLISTTRLAYALRYSDSE